jgi:hypothetical protein
VNLLGRLIQIDPTNLRFVQVGIIGGSFLWLDKLRSLVLCNQVDGLGHCLDALWVHEPVVDGVDGVVFADGAFPLEVILPIKLLIKMKLLQKVTLKVTTESRVRHFQLKQAG